MKHLKFPETKGLSDKPKVIALGKFESLHQGHRKLLSEGFGIRETKDVDFGIMLFTEREKNNIYSMEERLAFLKEYDLDFIWEFEPNQDNFNITAEYFEQLLMNMNVNTIIVGNDFRYGKGRQGTVETLEDNFNMIVIEKDEMSTSSVVDAIINTDFQKYKDLVGHYFFYEGEVVRGEGNGKKFGMPTANVDYPKYKIKVNDGIYFSYLIYDGKRMPSLTSISNNPTLGADKITYETYIYDFDKDIYGERVYVELVEKFRDPVKFESIEKLIDQLEEDKITGRKYFKI